MQQIYSKKSFVIYRVRDGYIVHNKEKPFKEGHTHITNINTAKYIINISINKKLPAHLTDYLMESLIRLSSDRDFAIKVENLRKIRKKGRKTIKI